MRVVYFAFEYFCQHGARTHARSFFDALSRQPHIKRAVIFPSENMVGINVDAIDGNSSNIRAIFKKKVKSIWLNWIPEWISKQIRLFSPSPRTYRSLKSVIQTERPDAIILRVGSMFRFTQRLRKDFPNLKIFIEFNASGFDETKTWILGRKIWRREEARQFGFADSVFVVSEYLRKYLLSLNPLLQGRIIVNPNGVDPEKFRPLGERVRLESRKELGVPEGSVVLGYVGGMESFRRLPEVVYQVAELRRCGMDRLFLVIIGTGHDKEKVSEAISDCYDDLSGWVYCSNRWVEHEHIPYLMAAFDIGIFPYSNLYGSPQKLVEYMSCALPIIGPDVPAVASQFDRKLLPFLVRQDGTNFRQTVRHLYDNIEVFKVKAWKTRKLVNREFTWEANASRVVNAIRTTLVQLN